MADLHSVLDQVLRETVKIITGEDFGPRPGQKDMAHDVLDAMINRTHVSGIGPTGVGKSVALLAPAMTMAAMCDERSVLSTESLALQSQVLDKDAPDVAKAVEVVTGHLPTFAVHKGFSNHVCHMATFGSIAEVTKSKVEPPKVSESIPESLQRTMAEEAMESVLEELDGLSQIRKRMKVGDDKFDRKEYEPLLRWAATDPTGDRARYTGNLPPKAWQTVSMTPQECPGVKSCPFASVCLPRASRAAAAQADIVVTNHYLLGIQAATAAPVVLGNRSLGNFQHLIVDEAHGLPSIVRNGGSVEVSGGRVGRAVSSFRSVIDDKDAELVKILDFGNDCADRLDRVLAGVKGLSERNPVEVEPADGDPVTEALRDIKAWAHSAASIIPEGDNDDVKTFLRLRRTKSRLERLKEEASTIDSDDGVPVAKWLEVTPYGRAYKSSPVDVAPHIIGNLFTADVVPDKHVSYQELKDDPQVTTLSVTMVSATLPTSFRNDSGINAATKEYPSPFDVAYGDSLCYCPKPTDEDISEVANFQYGKWKFDTNKHADWAANRIVELVDANGGSALVLSANVKNGKQYAELLRQRTDLRVYSQWDGRDSRLIVDDWRNDKHAVLVGTRSLMTGVDAKGDTCSLVIIDRVPRAMGNVVDDARVKAIVENSGMNRWAADKFVYVSDAALLLEQAFGRLIRTVNDSGLAVCLDPRIVPGSPLSYGRDSASVYLHAMRRFPVRRSSLTSAMNYLKEKHA